MNGQIVERGMADPGQAREYWTELVRGAADRCKLETIPTRLAKTPGERDLAKKQNACISRKSFGVSGHQNFDRIDWGA